MSAACVKCGCGDDGTLEHVPVYHPKRRWRLSKACVKDEHLHFTCRCGYEWCEPTVEVEP